MAIGRAPESTLSLRMPRPRTDGRLPAVASARRKILVIEDDVALSRALAVRLDALGFDAILAHDGVSGLEAVDARIDAVILDLGLPRLRGMKVARSILESLDTWHMPVIVITGDRSNNVSDYLRDLGVVAVVSKPFEADILAEFVDHHLGGDA